MIANVTVTERAAHRIGEILRQEPAGTMLRVSVEGGGCSGFQYKFDTERERAEDDIVIEKSGATVLVDPISLNYLSRFRNRFRRRSHRIFVQGQQSEGDRILRLRHKLRTLNAQTAVRIVEIRKQKPRDIARGFVV